MAEIGGDGEVGTVYVLHFHSPYKHAMHYIGWTRFLEKRLRHHERGSGAKLMKALAEAGIGYTIAVLYEGKTKAFERKLHQRKSTPRWCPICKEVRENDRAQWLSSVQGSEWEHDQDWGRWDYVALDAIQPDAEHEVRVHQLA